MLIAGPLQNSLRHAGQIGPQWLSLGFFRPRAGSLKERNDEPLRLHEDHLRRTNLSFHGLLVLVDLLDPFSSASNPAHEPARGVALGSASLNNAM